MVLLQNVATNFTGGILYKADTVAVQCVATGVFNGATFTLLYSPTNLGATEWLIIGTLTAPGVINTTAFNHGYFQASVTNVGSNTNVSAYLV